MSDSLELARLEKENRILKSRLQRELANRQHYEQMHDANTALMHNSIRELTELSEKYRLVVEQSVDGVAIIAGERFLYTSERLLEMLGCDQQGLHCQCAAHIFPTLRALGPEATEPEYLFSECQLQRADGHLFEAEICQSRIEHRQRDACLVIVRDISARKAAQRAEEAASRAKSEFLAQISHELRTPLISVMALSDLMQKTPFTAKSKDYLTTIHSSGRHLLGLIDNIIDFSRIGSGQLRTVHKPFLLSELMASVAAIVEPQLEGRDLQLIIDIPGNVQGPLVGDEVKLRQVLLNLLNNAVKYSDQGEILLDCYQLSDSADGLLLRFRVEDFGIGIAPAAQARIFDEFVRLEQTAGDQPGTGLGLAISKQLIELMGGKLSVNSEPGEGSTFYFDLQLPLYQGQWSGPQQGEGKDALSILIAEDNLTTQFALGEVFSATSHQVHMVSDGGEAMAALQQQCFDVIVLDMQMPVMTGLEVAKAWRQLETNWQTPILILTADLGNELVSQSQPYVNAIEAKPFVPAQLVAQVERLGRNGSVSGDVTVHSAEADAGDDEAALPVLDQQCLAWLQTGRQDDEFVRQFVAMFISDGDKLLAQLQSAVEAGELTEFNALAHKLKGSARIIGARRVAAVCQARELAAVSQARAQLAEIGQELATARKALRQYLASLLAPA